VPERAGAVRRRVVFEEDDEDLASKREVVAERDRVGWREREEVREPAAWGSWGVVEEWNLLKMGQ